MIVLLRNVGDDEDECWVPCAKGDPGAVQFVSAAPTQEMVEAGDYELWERAGNAEEIWAAMVYVATHAYWLKHRDGVAENDGLLAVPDDLPSRPSRCPYYPGCQPENCTKCWKSDGTLSVASDNEKPTNA